MFTGIIDHTASIQSIKKNENAMALTITHAFDQLTQGESISVDGVCLTVTAFTQNTFDCQLSLETLRLTTASHYQVGQQVNCERAMKASDRFGGHIVTGHVDKTIQISSIKHVDDFSVVCFSLAQKSDLQLLASKGSVTINGVSLTINTVSDAGFSVMLIPHTLAITNLSALKVNDWVNIEFDYLAKLVRHNINTLGAKSDEHTAN